MFKTPPNVRMSPEKSRVFNRFTLNQFGKNINRIASLKKEMNNRSALIDKLTREHLKSQQVYAQLVRRLLATVTKKPSLNLHPNARLVEQNIHLLKKIVKSVKAMTAARRTAKRLPFGQNITEKITRNAGISSLRN